MLQVPITSIKPTGNRSKIQKYKYIQMWIREHKGQPALPLVFKEPKMLESPGNGEELKNSVEST